jgi:hypothetical protein
MSTKKQLSIQQMTERLEETIQQERAVFHQPSAAAIAYKASGKVFLVDPSRRCRSFDPGQTKRFHQISGKHDQVNTIWDRVLFDEIVKSPKTYLTENIYNKEN